MIPAAALPSWAIHLALASAGLGLGAGLAAVWLARWRLRPVASYRLLIGVLVATLATPVLQAVVQGRFHAWADRVAAEAGARRALAVADDIASVVARPTRVVDVALSLPMPLPVDVEGAPDLPGPADSVGSVGAVEGASRSAGADTGDALVRGAAPTGPTSGEVATERPDAPISGADEGAGDGAAAVRSARIALVPLAAGLAAPLGSGLLRCAAVIWVLGLLLALARTARRLLVTRRLLRRARPVEDARVLAVWGRVRAGSRSAGDARLLLSRDVAVPGCFGVLRPRVVLPATSSALEDDEVLRWVLVHELVHLERRDTAVMFLQELLRALFWFHPAAWWLRRELDRLRELSCDALVVRRDVSVQGRVKRYASALLAVAADAARRAGPDGFPAATAVAGALAVWPHADAKLSRRIQMLISLDRRSAPRRAALAVVPGLLAFLWCGQLAAAALVPQGGGSTENADLTERAARTAELLREIGYAGAPDARDDQAALEEQHAELVEQRAELLEQLEALGYAQDARNAELALAAALEHADHGESDAALAAYTRALAASEQSGTPRIGIWLGEVSEALARQIGKDKDACLLITQVADGSLAAVSGLQAWDVIWRVEGSAPATRARLDEAKQTLAAGGSISVDVCRAGRSVRVAIGPIVERGAGEGEGQRRERAESRQARSYEERERALAERERALAERNRKLADELARRNAQQSDEVARRNARRADERARRDAQEADERARQDARDTRDTQRADELAERNARLAEELRRRQSRFDQRDLTVSPDEVAGLLETAQRYYSQVDVERFRDDLRSGLGVYRELAEAGRLNEESREYWSHVRDVLDHEDIAAYIDACREYLNAMSVDEFRGHLAESFDGLDPKTRQSVVERWRAIGGERESFHRGAGRAGGRADESTAGLRRRLQRTEELLQKRERQIEELSRRLAELEQRLSSGGGER